MARKAPPRIHRKLGAAGHFDVRHAFEMSVERPFSDEYLESLERAAIHCVPPRGDGG
jgi:hypothetical protein